MTKVRELTCVDAAKTAVNIYMMGGMQPVVHRLAYFIMSKEEKPGLAFTYLLPMIATLIDDEEIALTTVEYAASLSSEIEDAEARERLRVSHLSWRSDFLSPIDATKQDLDLFKDISEFKLDSNGLAAKIERGTNGSNDLSSAYKAARMKIGLEGGCLRHETLGTSVPFEELFDSNKFVETELYKEFLQTEKIDFESELR